MDNQIVLENGRLRVVIDLAEGFITPLRIEEKEGAVWADRAQQFAFDFRTRRGAVLRANQLLYRTHSMRQSDDGIELIIEGECAFEPAAEGICVKVSLIYSIARDEPVFTETLRIEVVSEESLFLHRASAVWRLEGRDGVGWLPIPFGEGHASTAPTLLTDEASGRGLNRDGAILFDNDGNNLVIAKTPSDRDPEYVVVESWKRAIKFTGFRAEQAFNDCSHWMIANRYESSPTRFELVRGPVERAFVAYRAFMETRGIGLPLHYDPPLNYCIYYECGNDWHREQAVKLCPVAADLGCTLLYTDQGWETSFGSGVWDDARLGACVEFVAEAEQHGLAVGVLVSLHAKKPSWPDEVYRRNSGGAIEDGDRWHPFGLCAGSDLWREEKTRKLSRLAADGVSFFSFDFNDCKAYTGFEFRRYDCHSTGHNHSVPMTQWEHVQAVAAQQREFREACPDAIAEAHDWALAGDSALPMYLFPASCQERWGFEYMWDPLADFKAGRLHNLYFYNLAYSRPLYLHMNLAKDNDHCVAFWYLASTIRHLGIGNFTALDSTQKVRIQEAMAKYIAFREFFTCGVFSGQNKLVHIHALPKKGAIVLLFNDTQEQVGGGVMIEIKDLALENQGSPFFRLVVGIMPECKIRGNTLEVISTIPPFGVLAFQVGE